MPTPAISILLPTYNGAAFLASQVDTILTQRFADFELLVCDDGSRDNTLTEIEALATRDRRIKILPSQGNAGQRKRLEDLWTAAQAPLIAISDQDDLWDEHKLALLHQAVEGRAMAFGSSHLIDRHGAPLGISIADRIGPPPRDGERLPYLFRPHVSAHAMLIRRELVSPTTWLRHAHFDWLLSLDAAFTHGITYVPNAIVRHRMHGGNQANGAFEQETAAQWFRPSVLYTKLQKRRAQRFRFFQATEHLAYSPCVDATIRTTFQRVSSLCAGAWFDPGVSRPFNNPKLFDALADMLVPFAGSAKEATQCEMALRTLTRAALYPTRTGSGPSLSE
jgi:glycosyltransferase involved in cell wall biosynthesis